MVRRHKYQWTTSSCRSLCTRGSSEVPAGCREQGTQQLPPQPPHCQGPSCLFLQVGLGPEWVRRLLIFHLSEVGKLVFLYTLRQCSVMKHLTYLMLQKPTYNRWNFLIEKVGGVSTNKGEDCSSPGSMHHFFSTVDWSGKEFYSLNYSAQLQSWVEETMAWGLIGRAFGTNYYYDYFVEGMFLTVFSEIWVRGQVLDGLYLAKVKFLWLSFHQNLSQTEALWDIV